MPASEFGHKDRREVLLAAVKLALSIQPPPLEAIGDMTTSLGWMKSEAQGPLEALYRTVCNWATSTDSPDDYRKATDVARLILVSLRSTATVRASELFDIWPQRSDSMSVYDDFKKQVEADTQAERVLRSPNRFLPAPVADCHGRNL
jgi:hypothetical protein